MSYASGIQQLSNAGLLPSSVSQSVLGKASPGQLNQIVGSGLALQQVNALFGNDSSSTDSATLSPTANALIQEINPSQMTSSIDSSIGTDPLTQAVSNELTSNLSAAVNQFLPQNTSANGSQINLLA
jgi:hypothetical protein